MRLGSNVQPRAIVHAAKSIGVVHRVCENFYKETKPDTTSQKYQIPSFQRDLQKILQELKEAQVFAIVSGRSHSGIEMPKSVFDKFNQKNYIERTIQTHLNC